MENRKMIVTDLDGTLLKENKSGINASEEYLQNLKDEGHIVAIATGRTIDSAIRATVGAEFANYIISDAGGRIHDMQNDKDIFCAEISKEDIQKIFSYFNENVEYIFIGAKDKLYKYKDTYIEDLMAKKVLTNKEEFWENCPFAIHMSIEVKKNEYARPLVEKLKKELPNLEFYVMRDSFGEEEWIEIAKKGTTKYNAITKVAEIEKIDNKDVIAFGDAINDIDMIQNSGVGVAMGNAVDEVKQVADFVTVSNLDDGVKVFLENYLK